MVDHALDEDIYEMTEEGYIKLQDDLKQLQKDKNENAKRIEEARSLGDLSENAEYQSAKEEHEKIDKKIMEVKYQIAHARIIDTSNTDNSVVTLGKKVTVRDLTNNKETVYILDSKAQPALGIISTSSPVGSELNNKKVGDEFLVKVPSGNRKLKVLKITNS